ncbi:MAG: HIT domain-containing protein [Aquificaceae bacterium]|nr:HIT domain-containing protein [Aquificaceae bacterium]MCX8060016.1 HIT domain-containing protein [Aquificaceae bacterium]MDW8096910.1 HIT domain-containing protein [Aquificaceae bacterium]
MRMLWAPWRSQYVEKVDEQKGCFLCEAASQPEEKLRDHLVLYRGRKAFVIFNKFPYNPGHLMVAPIDHVGDYQLLDEDTVLEMHRLTKVCLSLMKEVMKAHGVNLGYNLGRAAGAGLESHLHLHVVPRWFGDTNFMQTLAEVRVISQDLFELYDRMRPLFLRFLNAS